MWTVLLLSALLVAVGLGATKVWGTPGASGDSGHNPAPFAPPSSPPPAPSIVPTPSASPTSSTSISFALSDTQSGVTYLCSLDGSSFSACTSPKSYSSLSESSHTFKAEAMSGSKTSSATSYSWVISVPAPPAPSVTPTPSGSPTSSTSISFALGDTQSGVTYLCSLDGSSFASCTSPKSYSSLAQASHTFKAEAVSGPKTSAATSYGWVVDTPPVVSSIAAQGSNPNSSTGPVSWKVTFSKSVTGVGSSDFQLVPGGGLAGSPAISGVTGSGTTYTVTASSGTGSGTLGLNLVDDDSIKDAAGMALGGSGNGNGNATGGVFTFVRALPPVPTITSGPAASPAWTTTTNATFAFSDTQSGVSFLCKLDAGAFASCSSTKSYSVGQGSHTLQVEAQNSFGTSSAASRAWQVDTIAPASPRIVSGPNDPTNQTSGNFSVTDSDHTVVGLFCSLDGAAYSSCTGSPSVSGLHEGQHTFRVVARDQAGNQSDSDSWSWFVDLTAPPKPVITLAPPTTYSSTSATFLFFTIDPGHNGLATGYLCKLDTGAFTPCFLLQSYGGLSQGSHTFQVESIDQAGNISGAVSWTWNADTTGPAIAFTQTPPNPDSNTTPTFSWSGNDGSNGSGIAGYQCRLDNGGWNNCSSPDTLGTLSAASHTFRVVATDHAGNSSNQLSYTWTIQTTTTGTPFTITGNAVGVLTPGATPSPISLTIHNPNSVTIYVTAITVAVSNATCNPATNIAVHQVDLSTATPTAGQVAVPAGGSVTLPAQGVVAPTIQMLETGVNQAPACANQTFNLTYTGSAHS